MVAHETVSEEPMGRSHLRHASSRDDLHELHKTHKMAERFSQDDDSDTEDDAPLAAGLRHYMKPEKARSSQPNHSSTSPSFRVETITKALKGEAAHQTHAMTMPHQGNPSTPKENSGKRSKPEAPKFLLLLFEILQMENPKVIRWSEDGLSLQILDPAIVTDKILPKYFNHTNFHSFQRQLNYFGFRKWTKSKTDICTFSHPYFRQNQPELLQLIKRKKAPRRTPVAEKVEGYCNQLDAASSKKLLPLSPSGKRKLPTSDGGHHETVTPTNQQQPQQMNGLNVPIQPAISGIPIAPMHGHISAMNHDQGTQYLPTSALLNNVISPLAANESNKKVKKIQDKKVYLPNSDYRSCMQSPTDPTATSMCEVSSMHDVDRLTTVNAFSSTALPTLDIVRNRIIRRQQIHASGNGNDPFGGYYGYSSPHTGGPGSTSTTQQHMMEHRPDLMAAGRPMTPVGVGDHSPAFTNSFSDPVDILLRIKKSRTSSSDAQGQPQNTSDLLSPEKQAGDQSDNLASLHNFLISHTLYTNRLESQLKMAVDENDTLKHLVDAKHREVESLQSERKMLQHENAVLMEDKNKLFEINRELLGKLFPQ
uniref:HSF-type DNA-binding domain-containing protein n=1 Tax=Globisporangium ultimum (strain ATCC 200006 / CBS 805.95 / DAOM BR144) TaxID=431595 RepID=K3WEM4_GLOUD